MNTVTLIMLSSSVTFTGPPSLVDLEALPHSEFGRMSAEQCAALARFVNKPIAPAVRWGCKRDDGQIDFYLATPQTQ